MIIYLNCMPVLRRWNEDDDAGHVGPVQQRAGVWRYDEESSEKNPRASSSGYLGCN